MRLLDRLRRLSYTRVSAVAQPGEYLQTPDRIMIFRRRFRWGAREIPGALINLSARRRRHYQGGHGSTGQPTARAMIEPQVIGRLMSDAPAERVETPLGDLKPYVVDGLLATEDRYFYYHPGFDPVRMVEAAWADLRARRLVQGASTITQQLARTFLTRERSFARKFREAAVALVLEMRLRKDEILERYINDVPMGDYHGVPIYGLPMAARYLFGKDLREVTPAEAATLIGMIQAPTLYDPRRHPDQSQRRRDTVLAVMHRAGLLDDEQYRGGARRAHPGSGGAAGASGAILRRLRFLADPAHPRLRRQSLGRHGLYYARSRDAGSGAKQRGGKSGAARAGSSAPGQGRRTAGELVGRHRRANRRGPRDGRGTQLFAQPIQSCGGGAAPARVRIQTNRISHRAGPRA